MKTLRGLLATLTCIISSMFVFSFLGLIKNLFDFPRIKLEWIFLLPFLVAGGFFYVINRKAYSVQMRLLESNYLAEKFMSQRFETLKKEMTEEQRKKVTFNGFITFIAILVFVMLAIMLFVTGYFGALKKAISDPGDFGLWIFLLNLIIFIFIFIKNTFKEEGEVMEDSSLMH